MASPADHRGRWPLWRCFGASWIPRCHWHLYTRSQINTTWGWITAKGKGKGFQMLPTECWAVHLLYLARGTHANKAAVFQPVAGPSAGGEKLPYSHPHFCCHQRERTSVFLKEHCVYKQRPQSCQKGLLCSVLTSWYFLPFQTRGDLLYCFESFSLIQVSLQLETFRDVGISGIQRKDLTAAAGHATSFTNQFFCVCFFLTLRIS